MAQGRNRRNSWLRRLARNQQGSVMMEYIVIGLLIAAVSIAAVRMFGGSISDMFIGLTTAVVSPDSVGTKIDAARSNASDGEDKVTAHIEQITNGGGTGTGD